MRSSAILYLFALLVAGCSHTATYREEFISQELGEMQARIQGKALVVTDPKQDQKMYSERPSSLTGQASSYKAELGNFIRHMMIAALRRTFQDGAEHDKSVPTQSDYQLVIKPELLHFDYRYNQLKNLGVWITPESEIDIYVYMYDGNGAQLLEKKYKSDYISGGGYLMSFSPGEKINEAVHKAMFTVVSEMIEDIKRVVTK